MELRQFGYFVAVAQEGNFTRAAERANVAQSGISQQIRRLERELGEPLFDRSNHAVRLTDAGRAFLPFAQAALSAAMCGRTAITELRGLVRGQLLLGVIRGLPGIDLVGLVSSFRECYPGVDMTLREAQTEPLIADLSRGDFDVAIVGLAEPEAPPGLDIAVIAIEPLVMVTAPDHRLANATRVSLDCLRTEPLVTLTWGSGLRRHIESACAVAGFSPRVAFETSDVGLLAGLVARGLGVTILPESIAVASAQDADVRMITISPPLARRCTALAWRSRGPRSAATAAFIALARETLVRDPVRSAGS